MHHDAYIEHRRGQARAPSACELAARAAAEWPSGIIIHGTSLLSAHFTSPHCPAYTRPPAVCVHGGMSSTRTPSYYYYCSFSLHDERLAFQDAAR